MLISHFAFFSVPEIFNWAIWEASGEGYFRLGAFNSCENVEEAVDRPKQNYG